MSEIKRYEVAIDYKARDGASPALNGIERAAQRSAKSTGALTKSLIGFGAAIAGSRALGAAKSAFVSFNAGLEDSRVIMAGMLQMNVGGSMEANMARATKSVERFQQMAKASALTTKDLVGMAQMIEGPLLQAGAGMRQIEDLTFGAANAAKAFQIPAEMAALDIQQAINGTLSSKDRFAKSILSQNGINMSSEKFNSLSADKRLATLNKAFSSDAIKQMAKAQSETFSGVVSTLQDNLEMLAGRVGLPLFKAISKEVKGWNEWLERNQNKVERFAQSFASGLVTAFNYLRDGVGFIVRHADTLLMIGKVWASVKLVGAATGGIGKLVDTARGGFASEVGRFNLVVGTFITSMELATRKFEKLGVLDDIARQIDPAAASAAAIARSVAALEKAMDDAADAFRGAHGARGTRAYANLVGTANFKDAERKKFDDQIFTEFGLKVGGLFNRGSIYKNAYDSTVNVGRGMRDAQNGGPLDKLVDEYNNATSLRQRADFAALMTDTRIESVLRTMSQDQKDSVDIAAKTQQIMSAMNNSMALGQGPLSFEQVKAMLMPTAEELGKNRQSAKPPNINIAKVEVAAKDPDRWISDLNERVNKQIRAPKAAKRALRGGGF